MCFGVGLVFCLFFLRFLCFFSEEVRAELLSQRHYYWGSSPWPENATASGGASSGNEGLVLDPGLLPRGSESSGAEGTHAESSNAEGANAESSNAEGTNAEGSSPRARADGKRFDL